MQDEEEKQEGFRVKDRRRFDSSGNARDGAEEKDSGPKREEPVKSSPQSEAMPQASQSESLDAASEGSGGFEVNFGSFVVSLATQALMQLGEIAAPPGVEIPIDLAAAHQTIDLLNMLHEKTRGNLTKDEERLMEEILHSLRMSYVKHTSKK